jgi:hypothetical protein
MMSDETLVMDVSPWPNGRGFSGSSTWWNYVMNKEEKQRLDDLMGVALLDGDVRKRLVDDRDISLFTAFGLSKETQNWLRDIPANSLSELAQAIVSGQPQEAVPAW